MADVRPFRGLRYNADKVNIEKVVTQPYDKISREMQERYYAQDPHNIVRVILGKSRDGDTARDNVYTRAAAFLRDWRSTNIISAMPVPALIVYFQRFVVPGTSDERVRKGFIGLGRLEDYSKRIVYPHERTLAGPKQDRLELLRHTRTHFEQIFMLYDDTEQRIDALLDDVAQGPSDINVSDEYGVSHALWFMETPSAIERIVGQMADKRLIIADGHHRYETALAYRDERRSQEPSSVDAPYEWLPMTFFNVQSPALTVLPTHRVVRRLAKFENGQFFRLASEFFDIEDAPRDSAEFSKALSAAGRERLTIGVAYDSGRCALLRLKSLDLSGVLTNVSASQRSLDVVVLHRLLIERCLGITEDAVKHESNITYVREFGEAVRAVSTGDAQIAFLLNPVRLEQLRDIVYEGNVMPQKSTDFYPKVLSGLMLYSLDDAERKFS
jgi:uncharacterized protein (DUF1015 family)